MRLVYHLSESAGPSRIGTSFWVGTHAHASPNRRLSSIICPTNWTSPPGVMSSSSAAVGA